MFQIYIVQGNQENTPTTNIYKIKKKTPEDVQIRNSGINWISFTPATSLFMVTYLNYTYLNYTVICSNFRYEQLVTTVFSSQTPAVLTNQVIRKLLYETKLGQHKSAVICRNGLFESIARRLRQTQSTTTIKCFELTFPNVDIICNQYIHQQCSPWLW